MNIEKFERDIKLLLPSLGKESRILVAFFMPIIRGMTCGTWRWRGIVRREVEAIQPGRTMGGWVNVGL